MLRHQLPVLSPIPAQAFATAAARLLRPGRDAVAELAGLLRRDYAADAVVTCGSGTHALRLAIAAALRGGSDRDVVALPAFCCYDVASAAVGAGARIALYDVDPATLAPDLASLEAALCAGAAAVVVAPLYGIPVPWEPIEALASRHDARVIEDAAQGHGTSWRGRPLGALGRVAVLSFGRGKGWTGGRGGAVLLRGASADEDRLACQDGLHAAHGGASALLASAAQWLLARPAVYGIPAAIPWLGLGETRYHEPTSPGALPRAAAALALATRAASLREAEGRRARGAILSRELTEHGVDAVPVPEGGTAGYLRLPVRVADARRVADALSRAGVMRSYPTTLAELEPVRERLVTRTTHWPGAEALVRELVTIPTHGKVGEREAHTARRIAETTGTALSVQQS